MSRVKLPQQKKSFKSKTKEWREDNLNAIDNGISYFNSDDVRNTIKEKYILSNLFDGKLDMNDVLSTVSSAGVLAAFTPKKIQHRPIVRPKIELLVGEAIKEPFEWSVMVTDPKSIAEKYDEKKRLVNERVVEMLQQDYDEEQLKTKLKEMELYFKYTWKDAKEVRATKILKYYEKKAKMVEKLHECMIDKLNYGEEIMMFDIVGKTVEAFKLDPKKVYTLNSNESNNVADSDIIVIEEFWSPGKIIDHYYDELTPEEIKSINDRTVTDSDGTGHVDSYMVDDRGVILFDGMVDATMSQYRYAESGRTIDDHGNLRVLRCMWRSQKLVLVVKGIDPETGEPYEKVRAEGYKPDTLRGETIERVWVGEWWQGTKIGQNMYKKIGPRPVQYNSMGNLSKGHPGIVGRYNSTSGGKVVSFLGKMKPYQYLYDIVWDRLLDALKKNMGSIVEMDMAKKPAGWTTQKWLSYAYKGGIMFVDSFKEVQKGSARGKLAGNFNTSGKVMNTDTGNYIQQLVNLLEYIKKEMGDIVGVTPQREGAIGASANVGTTERSVMQSNNSTAYEFYTHELFKLECYQILLETAKVALRNNRDMAQIILDDMSVEMFYVDGDAFLDSDYSVFITTSKKSRELQRVVESYGQAFMQNGGSMSTAMDVLFSDSVAEKRRKIELAEDNMQKARQEEADKALKVKQEEIQAKLATAEREYELKKYEIDQDNATKIKIKEMEVDGKASTEGDKNTVKREEINSKERVEERKAEQVKQSSE